MKEVFMVIYLLVSIVIFGLYFFYLRPKIKRVKSENLKKLKDQLLRLFVPGEKLTGLCLHERLMERTANKCAPLLFVYKPPKDLVDEGKLLSKTSKILVGDEEINKVEYYLPE